MDESNEEENKDANYAETSFNSETEHVRLKAELESVRQKSYDLQCSLRLQEAVMKQLQESIESLEEQFSRASLHMDKRCREIEEKYRVHQERSVERLVLLETVLNEKIDENKELQQTRLKVQDALSRLDQNERHRTVNNNAHLEKQIEELQMRLQEETHHCEDAEQAMEDLKARYCELQNVVEVTRERLTEKSEALEGVREDLALLRAELNTPKPRADAKSSKGNSLFAEVEDRRKHTIEKFAALQSKHMEAKQACKAKVEEIKMLRAERAAMFSRWEHDFLDSKADSEGSLNEYKSKITHLEDQLRELIKKNSQSEEPGHANLPYEYDIFESMLRSKKQEVENLQIQIEDLSIKLLKQEEAKLNTEKQLRFWRYKASCLEVQTKLSKMELLYGAEDPCEGELGTLMLQTETGNVQSIENDCSTSKEGK